MQSIETVDRSKGLAVAWADESCYSQRIVGKAESGMSFTSVVLVAVGGAIGSVCRHLVAVGVARLLGTGFPWWTLAVNVVGSLLMGGLVAALALRFNGSEQLRLLLAVGFLGGFTTLSSFSLDAYTLWERGAAAAAAGYVAASILLSLAALVAGLGLARAMLS